jgi:molybdopterin converting factor small subunit
MTVHYCHEHHCHEDPLDVLIHGQELLLQLGVQIMATVAQVSADFDKYKTDVAAAFARLQASIDSNGDNSQALQDLDDAINGADTDANNEDQPPVEPGSGDQTGTPTA